MMCGNRNLATVAAGQTITPSLPTPGTLRSPGQAKFGKWMWAVAISLAITPILRIYSIVAYEIPRLYGEGFQPYLESHKGLSDFLYFEMVVNVILVVSALALNFLFYTRRKSFPVAMVAYVAATLLFLVAAISSVNSIFPDSNMTHSYVSLIRYLIWAAAMIIYLLTSSEVKERFVN